jgi:hypothetical protein
MARPKKLNLALLASIATATQANQLVYATPADIKPMLEYKPNGATTPTPLVEQNPGIPDPSDPTKFATRATPDGIALSNANPPQAKIEHKPRGPAPVFEMEFTSSVPERKRGSAETIYPFAAMPAPDLSDPANHRYAQFYVKATEAMPNPAKSLNSTVSSANRRYASEAKDANGNVIKNASGKVQKNVERRFVIRAEPRWFDANGAVVPAGTAGATKNDGACIIREK